MKAGQIAFENIWERLLSRESDQILAAFKSLTPDEKIAVREHLGKMVREPGWQPGQRISAQAALDAIAEA